MDVLLSMGPTLPFFYFIVFSSKVYNGPSAKPRKPCQQKRIYLMNLVVRATVENPCGRVKATVENPRGSVEKLSPKASIEGGDTVLRGSVRVPGGFSEGKPKASKLRGGSPRDFAAEGLPEEKPGGALTLPCSTVSTPKDLS